MAKFEGFPEDTLGLLGGLPLWDPAWYAEHKPEVTATLIDPARALVADLGERFRAELSPGIEAQPKINGSISPLNEDLRFVPDKPPYRDYLMVNFWDGAPKKVTPTVRVRIHPSGIGFGGGAAFDKGDLERWRATVADARRGTALEAALAPLRELPHSEVAGEALKRVPAPYEADDPRGVLLRHKMIQVRWQQPVPAEFWDERFVDWCFERLMRFEAFHHWLLANMAGGVHAAPSR
jgi:uncharacterized protein (DUF2461 family)